MRVTVQSADDTLVLESTMLPHLPGWWLADDGLDASWFGTPDVNADVAAVPQQDGAYVPALVTVAHRILTIRGFVSATESTLQVARAHARVNALVKKWLRVCVDDGGGPLWVSGFISSPTAVVVHWSEQLLTFSLIITCPDPVKYGSPVLFSQSGGTVLVENNGTSSVDPVFVVSGLVSRFTASLGGQKVSWSGPTGDGLLLDAADGLPMRGGVVTGTVTEDDFFKVPPGQSQVTVSSDGQVQIEVSPGWL